MSVNITIYGESAADALHDLRAVAAALLGGASVAAIAAAAPSAGNSSSGNSIPSSSGATSSPTPSPTPAPAAAEAAPSGPEGLDAHGHPWSAELHASTGTQTKEGLWRMKVGVSRPDPMPGYPKAEASGNGATSTPTNGTEPAQAASATGASAGVSPEDEDDEFAAFRAATAASDASAAAAVASAPARKYSDADLAVHCNNAAVKLGDPAPVKALIAEYVGPDAVAHSRNVPDDKRAAFVAAIEAKAGITFGG